MVARPIIIDCDPGADDAIALFLALAYPDLLNVLAITTVAGNVPLELTQRNARCLCELAGRADIPIYAGCPRPLLRPLVTAEEVHGRTGLDGIVLPEPQIPLQRQHAVEYLTQTLMGTTEKITLATLGPLTNLAVAIIQQPSIVQHIQEVVVMGGALTQGNITPSAEFNVYVDPHAAQVVFSAGVPLTLVTLDVTHQAIATPERLSRIRQLNSPVSTAMVRLIDHYAVHDMTRYGFAGAPLHDPCVIAYLLQPNLFTQRSAFVEVETLSPLTSGRTVVDIWRVTGKPENATVLDTIQADRFYQLLTNAIAAYSVA